MGCFGSAGEGRGGGCFLDAVMPGIPAGAGRFTVRAKVCNFRVQLGKVIIGKERRRGANISEKANKHKLY